MRTDPISSLGTIASVAAGIRPLQAALASNNPAPRSREQEIISEEFARMNARAIEVETILQLHTMATHEGIMPPAQSYTKNALQQFPYGIASAPSTALYLGVASEMPLLQKDQIETVATIDFLAHTKPDSGIDISIGLITQRGTPAAAAAILEQSLMAINSPLHLHMDPTDGLEGRVLPADQSTSDTCLNSTDNCRLNLVRLAELRR